MCYCWEWKCLFIKEVMNLQTVYINNSCQKFCGHLNKAIIVHNKYPCGCQWKQKKGNPWRSQTIYVTGGRKSHTSWRGAGKKGTIAGAVALIIGTSIGSGILALPQKASPAVKCFLFFSVCICARVLLCVFLNRTVVFKFVGVILPYWL